MTETELVKQYRPLVFKTAQRFEGQGVALDDLAQEGFLAAIRSFRRWKKNGGSSLLTWLHLPIWWAMWMRVNADREKGSTGSRWSSPDSREKITFVSMDEEFKNPHSRLLDWGKAECATLHDSLGDFQEPPDFILLNRLQAAINQLRPRDKEVIRMRFVENLTFAEAGKKIGTGSSRVLQIERRAILKLRELLRASEDAT